MLLRATRTFRPAALLARGNSYYIAPPVPTHPHHSPSAPIPPPPPGVEVDPQLHGYPQLPEVSLQLREPFGWWDIQERKNFDEPVMEEEDYLGMWGPDVFKIGGGAALLALTAALGLVGAFGWFVYETSPPLKAVRREYPYGGLEKALGGYPARKEQDDVEE
ncbi:hypothetical protein CcaverHIS002_0701030 [Cutaneotrichosporon cavernicola]|uniref:Uncharacterized protein n=1 Tax=Cutaneotrichosporon cavernicola TaxID=279322 RepID=A0AA48QYH5_9TREE|nr:uncharacterized protein CcaverHIS019_0701040 [Cutaneotrichosporon cavernicola]BEI86757.1 hypothetical protein CcaverHIS002_0701030 [Cutaneotrichosporon cavernicola]BEI94532.1 hypothetical protein CcaverHIS019_0701040 [Cutaneotrichosporon cavernicola]BEJ02308.1 hypothetical protein CcaverHIS631_0701030 [Cutaneotrichosporon cavernicola]BEJ10067.1 hypothetical protein CcaverHIS641_0701020 [Cutaneotrichosporon cavernicola]